MLFPFSDTVAISYYHTYVGAPPSPQRRCDNIIY
jgi:hypothetical protein